MKEKTKRWLRPALFAAGGALKTIESTYIHACLVTPTSNCNITLTNYTLMRSSFDGVLELLMNQQQFVTLVEFGTGYVWEPVMENLELHNEALTNLLGDLPDLDEIPPVELIAATVNTLVDFSERPRLPGLPKKRQITCSWIDAADIERGEHAGDDLPY